MQEALAAEGSAHAAMEGASTPASAEPATALGQSRPARASAPLPAAEGTWQPLPPRRRSGLRLRLAARAGRVGLENLGNTCFMSAGLQCLSHVEPFAAYFLSGAYCEEVNRESALGCKGKLADAFADLQRALWQEERASQNPRILWRTLTGLAPHLFRDRQQQDIQEFLTFCLDGLHEDLNRVVSPPPPSSAEEAFADERLASKRGEEFAAALSWMRYLERGKSFLVDLMQGQLRSSLSCMRCGQVSRRFEPFLYLSLPVSHGMSNLADALRCFVEEEVLVGDERWVCKGCGQHVEARKKIDLWKLPPVLVIHLKRWSTCGGTIQKIDGLLSAPQELDLSSYCSSPQPQGAHYKVVCVANHVGVYGSGHYTATCRVGERWYHFDDEIVSALGEGEEAVGQHAYVVFLVRHSTEGGCYTAGHHAPLLKRQTLKLPRLWPHRLSDKTFAHVLRRRASLRDVHKGLGRIKRLQASKFLPRSVGAFLRRAVEAAAACQATATVQEQANSSRSCSAKKRADSRSQTPQPAVVAPSSTYVMAFPDWLERLRHPREYDRPIEHRGVAMSPRKLEEDSDDGDVSPAANVCPRRGLASAGIAADGALYGGARPSGIGAGSQVSLWAICCSDGLWKFVSAEEPMGTASAPPPAPAALDRRGGGAANILRPGGHPSTRQFPLHRPHESGAAQVET
mmetsp:Transcript_41607/g.114695  ORF Transcript_41607/g.114695 Transcript_41607/m.114695 type:complete len:684 (-) Transcript_41607:123-2174(-)